MSSVPETRLTPTEYLAIERASDQKHEFYAGEMFAMAGAKFAHNLIVSNLIGVLHGQLKGGPCYYVPNDMRVLVDRTGLYTYPDIVVTCEEPQFEDDEFDTLLNPLVIFEVLSESTAAYDRGKKFDHYRQVASLKEYVLVAQDEPHIEVFTRQPDDRWLLGEAKGVESAIELESLGVSLSLGEAYARVDFSTDNQLAGDQSTTPT